MKKYVNQFFNNLSSGGSDGRYEALLAKLQNTTATADDVDTGKIFIDSNTDEITGTSTAKTELSNLQTYNDSLEAVLNGN